VMTMSKSLDLNIASASDEDFAVDTI
jgi:hypothetical protein